jgi:hypothetical protein
MQRKTATTTYVLSINKVFYFLSWLSSTLARSYVLFACTYKMSVHQKKCPWRRDLVESSLPAGGDWS